MTSADGSGHRVPPSGREPAFVHRSVAEPGRLQAVRLGLHRWLSGLQWPEPDQDDVVLAVSEACTNVVEHAYPSHQPGEFAVVARLRLEGPVRRVTLLVRDWGHWRPVPTEPGYRGHGLTVIRGCVEQLDIRHTADGTYVAMTSTAVPSLMRGARRSPVGLSAGGAARNTITVAAADPVTAQRRHRHAVVVRRTDRLTGNSANVVAAALRSCARAHDTVQASSRAVADARRIRDGSRHDGEQAGARR